MGIKLFSSGSTETVTYIRETVTSPNPNKFKFTVIRLQVIEGLTLVWANYPDCSNYNGNKIILTEGWNVGDEELDPHFLEFQPYTVLARFIPTELGWELGKEAALYIAMRRRG